MPREPSPTAGSIQPITPEWETFQIGHQHANHLTVAYRPGVRVTLCGQHLETRRIIPLELAPHAVRCSACERRLEPGGPELLTPASWQRISDAELIVEASRFEGTPEAHIQQFIKRTVRNWERILLRLKGYPQ